MKKSEGMSVTRIQALVHGEVIKGANLLQSCHPWSDLTRARSGELTEQCDSHTFAAPTSCGLRLQLWEDGAPCTGATWSQRNKWYGGTLWVTHGCRGELLCPGSKDKMQYSQAALDNVPLDQGKEPRAVFAGRGLWSPHFTEKTRAQRG